MAEGHKHSTAQHLMCGTVIASQSNAVLARTCVVRFHGAWTSIDRIYAGDTHLCVLTRQKGIGPCPSLQLRHLKLHLLHCALCCLSQQLAVACYPLSTLLMRLLQQPSVLACRPLLVPPAVRTSNQRTSCCGCMLSLTAECCCSVPDGSQHVLSMLLKQSFGQQDSMAAWSANFNCRLSFDGPQVPCNSFLRTGRCQRGSKSFLSPH